MRDEFDDALRGFVREYVHSIAQLELLLLLQREPERAWNPENVTRALGLSLETASELLQQLCRDGLARPSVRGASGNAPCHYAPGTSEVDDLVQQLAHAYRERRVTLIRWIYAPPAP